jgi:ferric-dicitrate binding protein FerR (iron transport regulator)
VNLELQDLIDRYVDGSASPEDVRRLDELARQDPSTRQAMLASAAMEVHLRRLVAGGSADVAVAPVRRPRALRWTRVAQSAAVFLLAVSGWAAALLVGRQYRLKCDEHETATDSIAKLEALVERTARHEAAVQPFSPARLVEMRGLVLALPEGKGDAAPLSVGSAIPVGRSLWTCPWGAAAIRLANGVSLQLDRNTVVSLSEAKDVLTAAVKHGILFVAKQDAAKKGSVTVSTAHTLVKVVDAQVAVAVDAGRTIVEVAEGRAQVTRTPDNQSVTVPANHYVIVGPDAKLEVVKGRLVWQLGPTKPSL